MAKVTPEQIEKEVEIQKESKNKPVCGHVNKQHTGTDGKLQDLSCILPKEHSGDHKARHMRKVGEPVTNEKGQVLRTEYHEEEVDASWGDVAGKPVSEISEEATLQMSLLQKDLVMQILTREPALDAKQAIAKAKLSKEWNAA